MRASMANLAEFSSSGTPKTPPGDLTRALAEEVQIDYTGPGLPFPEFVLWARRLREAELDDYRKQFKAADFDGSEIIQKDELPQVMKALGYMPLGEVLDEVIGKCDVDNDSGLDFDEFVNL